MNIRDFKYLIAIDELQSFVKAAQKCFISQPALSQQVKKLEDQLGFKIFERGKKLVITTPKGKEIVKYAKSIIASYEKIHQIGKADLNLKIALIPTICPYLLPHISNDLHLKFPKIKFFFLEEKTDQLIAKLKKGKIDIGIIAHFDELIDEKIAYKDLYEEEFLLALNKKSKLNQSDFSKIMAQKKLILLEEGNCISDNIKEICDIYSQNSFSDFYATNIETVKNMVKVNNGAAILPKLSCLKEKDLNLFSFDDKKYRKITMIYRKSYDNKKMLDDLATQITKSFSKIKG